MSAYHHVKIHPDHHTLLGCCVPHPDTGEDVYFVFACMPFGLSTATHVLTRLTKPICLYITRHGIRHTIFIDDGKVNGADKEILLWAFQFVLDTLRQAGFVVSEKKSDTPASVDTTKVYLGFQIDSVDMVIKAQDHKISSVREAILRLLRVKTPTEAKILASVIGKVIALEAALGAVIQLLSRAAQADLAEAVDKFGWKAKIRLSELAKDCLQTLATDLEFFNGSPIQFTANATPLRAILDNCLSATPVHGWHALQEKDKKIAAGDASDKAVCAYGVTGLPDLYLQVKLKDHKMKFSSGHRELLTVKYALQKKVHIFEELKSSTILWLTDSTNMVAFLSKGSTRRHILPDILQTFKAARDLNIRIIPLHVSREDYRIQEADHGSCFFDPDDCTIDALPSSPSCTFGP